MCNMLCCSVICVEALLWTRRIRSSLKCMAYILMGCAFCVAAEHWHPLCLSSPGPGVLSCADKQLPSVRIRANGATNSQELDCARHA